MAEDSGEVPSQEGQEEEPAVYAVQKDIQGSWKFSRRNFLKGVVTTGAITTTAALGTVGIASKADEESAGDGQVLIGSIPLVLKMPIITAVKPRQPFTQVWEFTNQGDTPWQGQVSLCLSNSDPVQVPSSVHVPEMAPGETVAVRVDMAAPAELSSYEGNWSLQDAGHTITSGSFTILDGCIAESPHPYTNALSQTWTLTNPDASAQHTCIHFSRLEVETNYDYVILKNGVGEEVQRITGSYPTGLWSRAVPGRDVQVQLVTDATTTGWGFSVDQLQTSHVVYLPAIIKQSQSTPDNTATPIPTKTATPVSCLVESPHPYANNTNQTWSLNNPDLNAEGTRVHFYQVELEVPYDYINIKDGTGQLYQKITNNYPVGVWSNAVPGKVIQIQLVTDGIITKWGFCIDQLESTAEPPTPTPTFTPTPCTCVGVCSCNTHCTCDQICTCNTQSYWYPN